MKTTTRVHACDHSPDLGQAPEIHVCGGVKIVLLDPTPSPL